MKIFISTDMEGISGVVDWEQVRAGAACYNEGRQYLTEDINACVEGCFQGGATEVTVSDRHSRGRNVLWHQLDSRASYIVGVTERSPEGRMPGIEAFDALILLGYHAMAGTRGAVLRHTWSSVDWYNFRINGKLSGEVAMETYLAADYGVPAIMVSGDDKVCAEAAELVPNIVTAQVKQGLTRFGARLLSRDAAHSLITQKAAEAVGRLAAFTPLKIEKPVTLRVEYTEKSPNLNVYDKPYAKIIDDRTFEVTGESFREAFYRVTNP